MTTDAGFPGTTETLEAIAGQRPDYRRKWEEAIHFIEMTEALTHDPQTALRIHTYLREEGIW
jgi:hypothetical protein